MQGTTTNKLASAGALVDDTAMPTANGATSSTPSTDVSKDDVLPARPVPEQRILLLQALLSIGDLPHALYFLGRYPWLAQTHTTVADLIMLIVAHALEPLYRSVVAESPQSATSDFDWEAAAPEVINSEKPTTVTLLNPPPPNSPSRNFQFFYPSWAAGLEEWSSVDELFTKGLRWLGLVRGLAARDSATMVKICRMGAAHFAALRKEKENQMQLPKGVRTSQQLGQSQVCSVTLVRGSLN